MGAGLRARLSRKSMCAAHQNIAKLMLTAAKNKFETTFYTLEKGSCKIAPKKARCGTDSILIRFFGLPYLIDWGDEQTEEQIADD